VSFLPFSISPEAVQHFRAALAKARQAVAAFWLVNREFAADVIAAKWRHTWRAVYRAARVAGDRTLADGWIRECVARDRARERVVIEGDPDAPRPLGLLTAGRDF
jgi:hypothetical protein